MFRVFVNSAKFCKMNFFESHLKACEYSLQQNDYKMRQPSLVFSLNYSSLFHVRFHLLRSGIPEHCHGSNISKGNANKPT